MKQALRLSPQGATPAAPTAAGPSTSAPAAAAPSSAPKAVGPAKGDEIYLLGGNSQVDAGADGGGWLSSVLIFSPASQAWRQGGSTGAAHAGAIAWSPTALVPMLMLAAPRRWGLHVPAACMHACRPWGFFVVPKCLHVWSPVQVTLSHFPCVRP